MQLRYSAPPDQYNRGLSIGNLSQTSWAQFPDFSPSFIFASYLFISSMHEARYHKVHCVYQTCSRDVMHSPPSCLRNFLAELSFNVLLLWMKVDRSPPSQYSIIRKMCVSHHCKEVDTTWPKLYILKNCKPHSHAYFVTGRTRVYVPYIEYQRQPLQAKSIWQAHKAGHCHDSTPWLG